MKSLTLLAALAAMTMGAMPLARAHGMPHMTTQQRGMPVPDAGQAMTQPEGAPTVTWQQFQPPSYGRFLAQQYNTDNGA